MTERGAKVIAFPTWRRQAGGAPGVEPAPSDLPEASDVPDTQHPVEVRERPRKPEPPTPRESAEGVPARGQAGAGWVDAEWVDAWRPIPHHDDAAWMDEPVWHEGASRSGESVIRLRADLLGIKPPLWRRLELRGSLTLDRVHPVFAAAFGWSPESEYRFRDVVRDDFGTRVGCTFGNEWTSRRAYRGPAEWTVRLDQVLSGPRARLRYTYGRRGFDITVVAEDVMPLPPASAGEVPSARLLTGRRAGPPQEYQTAGMYGMAMRGVFTAQPQLAELLRLSPLPDGFDTEAIDLALLDSRVRAAADS